MRVFCFYSFCFALLFSEAEAQPGCTDPLAINFNASATINDGSCLYSLATISPTTSLNLSNLLPETSGLIQWNNYLWTHNDNTDLNLYLLDTASGNIVQSHPMTGTFNDDWEEISQDSNYVYIGDFGNNANGNRTNLHILRVEKNSILSGSPLIDTISYSYSDQTDFTPTGTNNTNFDCEAFVVAADSIYLFTKQWVSLKTSVYSIPKSPGSYSALLKTTYDVQGLVTGAVILEQERMVALCGYSNLLQPFIFLLYDFTTPDFFSGNKRKISLNLGFHQAEGITTSNGLKFYLTNEYFSQSPVTTLQKLHVLDLSAFLGNYLVGVDENVSEASEVFFYPNPANDVINIESKKSPVNYWLLNIMGQTVESGILTEGKATIKIAGMPAGMYFLRIGYGSSLKVVKE